MSTKYLLNDGKHQTSPFNQGEGQSFKGLCTAFRIQILMWKESCSRCYSKVAFVSCCNPQDPWQAKEIKVDFSANFWQDRLKETNVNALMHSIVEFDSRSGSSWATKRKESKHIGLPFKLHPMPMPHSLLRRERENSCKCLSTFQPSRMLLSSKGLRHKKARDTRLGLENNLEFQALSFVAKQRLRRFWFHLIAVGQNLEKPDFSS